MKTDEEKREVGEKKKNRTDKEGHIVKKLYLSSIFYICGHPRFHLFLIHASFRPTSPYCARFHGNPLAGIIRLLPLSRAPQRVRGAGKEKKPPQTINKEVPMEHLLHKELSDKVLGMAFSVHNILGPGLLESAYEGALCIELARSGVPFDRQVVYPLHYKGELAGAYIADIVVARTVILELKSVSALNRVMEAQLINYLKLSGLPVGYLMNFNGLKLEWRRFVNQRE